MPRSVSCRSASTSQGQIKMRQLLSFDASHCCSLHAQPQRQWLLKQHLKPSCFKSKANATFSIRSSHRICVNAASAETGSVKIVTQGRNLKLTDALRDIAVWTVSNLESWSMLKMHQWKRLFQNLRKEKEFVQDIWPETCTKASQECH